MRIALRFLYISIFGAVCFFLGIFYEQWSNPNEPPVTVLISNQSGQEIKSVVISHNGSGGKGTLVVDPPLSGSSKTARFFVPGEGSFSIEATLENGKVLKAISGYIVSGNSLSMVITATDISGGLDMCSNPSFKRDCRKSAAAP